MNERTPETSPDISENAASGHCSAPVGFQPVHLIGTGTFADIWLVENNTTQQQLVWKQLRNEWRQNATAKQLLTNESEVLQAHESNYVVRGIENPSPAKQPGILQEFVTGKNLNITQGENPIPISRAIWIARQVALGIADLNRCGFTHGDIKTSNIMIRPDGSIVLIDLGFSKSLRKNKQQKAACIVGTPEYLAPEVVSGEPQPLESKDIYSLGVVLFKMLTGTLPFQGQSATSTLALARRHRSPLLQRWCPHAPDALIRLVSGMLAKQPWRRPAGMQVVIRELLSLELATLSRRQIA